MRDIQTNLTQLITVGSAGKAVGGSSPSISGDGCRIAFLSTVSLVAPPSSGAQVYVRDRCVSPATVTRVSVFSKTSTPTPSAAPVESHRAISGDGTHVLFSALTDLSGGGATCNTGNFAYYGCLFVHDMDTRKTARVDVASDGTGATLPAQVADISNNGSLVVFASEASNLVTGDGNFQDDAFVHDRDLDHDGVMDESGQRRTVRISVTAGNPGGQVYDNDSIFSAAISGNGAFAAFSSSSTTLVPGNPNPNQQDVFVRNLATGALERFGRRPGDEPSPQGSTCCGNSVDSISDDGLRVAFGVGGSLPGGYIWGDVFARNRSTGAIEKVINTQYDPGKNFLPGRDQR